MTWIGEIPKKAIGIHEEQHPTEICGAAEPAELDVTSDAADAAALTFAGYSDDDCPAEDSEEQRRRRCKETEIVLSDNS